VSDNAASPSPAARPDVFVTTRWTLVVAAGRGPSADAARALEELCRVYWYPLYAYARRHGRAPADAEDLTQGFFARFLARNYLEGLDADHGRFRAFLLAAFKHFLANEADKAARLKRGGDAVMIPLDAADAEARYAAEPADTLSPDKLYDRAWARALLERVLARLRGDLAADGRTAQFDALVPFLTAGEEGEYAAAAAALGASEGAVRVAVHRLRRRYRELLREEVAQTLTRPELAEDEIRSLFLAFAG
jgi:RNA polymerase sigma factor (sigma-70 family)